MVRLTSVYNDGWVFQHIDHDALEKVDVLSHRSQTTKVLGCGAGILYFFHISGEEHVVALQPTDVFLSRNQKHDYNAAASRFLWFSRKLLCNI